MRSAATAALLIVLFVGGGVARAAIPSDELRESLQFSGFVNDYAHLLSESEKQSLEARCEQLRQKSGAELAVVTLRSLEGGEIHDFTNKLFARWKVGQKGQDNGLMLLVAIEDRKAWIEVGYGLEPILPDALAGRVLDEKLFPAFKQGRYAEGLAATVEEIAKIAEKGEKAPNAQALNSSQALGMVAFLAVFVAVGAFLAGLGLGSKVAALILFGLIFSGGPMIIGWSLAAPLAPLIHTPLFALCGWRGWLAGVQSKNAGPRGKKNQDGDFWSWNYPGSYGGSSWSSGGFSGGSFSGGGGGFGGFSGGSSGGGGAGGSW